MDYFSNLWKPTAINQASHIALPITKQDDIRSQLKNPIERKPDAYKSINSSQIRLLPTEIQPIYDVK